MILLLNDLSIHNQFDDVRALESALYRLVNLRALARNYDREVHCGYGLSQRPAIRKMPLTRCVNDRDLRNVLLGWLDKAGPYWQAEQAHVEDDFYAYDDDIVTGSALAEAACLLLRGQEACCVSTDPSDWLHTPLVVKCGLKETTQDVENHWAEHELQRALSRARPFPRSWDELQQGLILPTLIVANDAFAPLRRLPFNRAQASAIERLVSVLEELSAALVERDENTRRKIMDAHFIGDTPKFSDSSDTEKRNFCRQMTFIDPHTGSDVACFWHGKVTSGTLRLHFTDPHIDGRPIALCYVGPKITKK